MQFIELSNLTSIILVKQTWRKIKVYKWKCAHKSLFYYISHIRRKFWRNNIQFIKIKFTIKIQKKWMKWSRKKHLIILVRMAGNFNSRIIPLISRFVRIRYRQCWERRATLFRRDFRSRKRRSQTSNVEHRTRVFESFDWRGKWPVRTKC